MSTSAEKVADKGAEKGAEKGTVAIAFVREALLGVSERGLDPLPLLRAAGIAPALLHTEGARVSAASFGTLWLEVAAALDDEFFGLDSRRMKVGSFATLCHLMLHTRNLREALVRGARLVNLLLDDTRLELDQSVPGEAALLIIDLPSGDDGRRADRRVFAHETLFVMLHGLMCWLVGRRIDIRRARFAYPAPAWWPEYRVIYSGDVGFDAPVTRFAFGALELEAPVIQTERAAHEFLRAAPRNFILKYKDPRSQAARIRRRLRGGSPDDWPSFEALAREYRLSVSTLRRRLDQEGASFRAIKDGLRRDMAIRLLTRTDQTVTQVAAALGFAEASAFHRAFRQWTGVSPGDYRRGSGRGSPSVPDDG